MINAISDITPQHLINRDAGSTTLQKNNATDAIASIVNLPVEMLQKIAWDLNTKDYASLRATCFSFSRNLYSLSTLNHILKNNPCRGEFKEKSELILNNHFVNKIRNEPHLLEAIQTLKSVYICEQENIPAFDMKVSYEIYPEKKRDLLKVIESIHEHIKNCFFKSSIEVNKEQKSYILSFVLDMHFGQIQPGEIFPVEPFFNALKTIFDNTANASKYLIAVLAAELIQLWTIRPPRGSSAETVKAINSQYKDLIQTGEMAKRIAKEESSLQ